MPKPYPTIRKTKHNTSPELGNTTTLIDPILINLPEITTLSEPSFLNNNSSIHFTMKTSTSAPQTQTYDLQKFRMQIDFMPKFKGDPHTLNVFLASCEELLIQYVNPTTTCNDPFILSALKSRLEGKALRQLGARTFGTWNELRIALTESFSSGKKYRNYIDEINNAHRNPNETILEFTNRLSELHDLLIDFLNAQPIDASERRFLRKQSEETVINTIIKYSHTSLKEAFYIKRPTTLHDTIEIVQDRLSFESLFNMKQHLQNQLPPKPTNTNFKSQPQLYNRSAYPNPQPNRQSNFPQINYQPRERWPIRPTPPPRPAPPRPPMQSYQPRPTFSGQYQNQSTVNRQFQPQYSRPNNNYFQNRMDTGRTTIPPRHNPYPKPTPMEVNNADTYEYSDETSYYQDELYYDEHTYEPPYFDENCSVPEQDEPQPPNNNSDTENFQLTASEPSN